MEMLNKKVDLIEMKSNCWTGTFELETDYKTHVNDDVDYHNQRSETQSQKSTHE